MKNVVEVFNQNMMGQQDMLVGFGDISKVNKMRFLWISGSFDDDQISAMKQKLGNVNTLTEAKNYLYNCGIPCTEMNSEDCLFKREITLWKSTCIEKSFKMNSPFEDLVYVVHGNRPITAMEQNEFDKANQKIYDEYKRYIMRETNFDEEFIERSRDLKDLVRSKGLYIVAISNQEYLDFDKEFRSNRFDLTVANKKFFGLEKTENALFVLYKPKSDELVGVVNEQSITDAECLEMAVMEYKMGQTMLNEKEDDTKCYLLNDVCCLDKKVTVETCRDLLQKTFDKYWKRTLDNVLYEKGDISVTDYLENHWIRDFTQGVKHFNFTQGIKRFKNKTNGLGVKHENSVKKDDFER